MHWIDPVCLPETRGRVTQFLLNPHGEIDGLILDGRLQVHVPPHLGPKLARHVAPGERVRVRGVKPRGADVIAAVQLIAHDGTEIVDEGPPHPRGGPKRPDRAPRPMEASGEVVLPLHGPRGELWGALLADGTSLRMPPHAAAELSAWLARGVHVQAWGHGSRTRHGVTLDVDEIAELVDVGQSGLPARAAASETGTEERSVRAQKVGRDT